jgi:hypothetical protein
MRRRAPRSPYLQAATPAVAPVVRISWQVWRADAISTSPLVQIDAYVVQPDDASALPVRTARASQHALAFVHVVAQSAPEVPLLAPAAPLPPAPVDALPLDAPVPVPLTPVDAPVPVPLTPVDAPVPVPPAPLVAPTVVPLDAPLLVTALGQMLSRQLVSAAHVPLAHAFTMASA